MQRLSVFAATLAQTPLDWDRNLANAKAALDGARDAGAGIVCLPELCLTGYGCEDAFLFPGTAREAASLLEALLPASRGLVASVGLPVWVAGAVFNASALLVDGKLVGLVAKRSLAGDGLHYEPRWFRPWPEGATSEIELCGARVPVGDLVFDVGGVRVGFEICEDAWVAKRPGGELSLLGVDVILNPSASHFAFGKHAVRRRLVEEGSRAFGCAYVYANLLGNEAGRAIYDGDALVASGGEVLAEARRMGFGDVGLTGAVVDLEVQRAKRAALFSYRPDVAAARDRVVAVPHAFPAPKPVARLEPEAWEHAAEPKAEELLRAVALGLFHYLEKTRSRGFVVSLSGGCDSAAVACLVSSMVALGTAELGLAGFAARLSHVPALASCRDARAMVGVLLTTAYQATRHSGAVTREAARAVAEAVGARHVELDVDDLVERYERLAESVIGRPLAWDTDDVARQNVQARVRSPSVWMIANVEGALLLSTSNRSEAAVGYATMDGDTSGGLAPIAGVDKAYLRRWLVWLEREGPTGLAPVPALAAVNAQAPTAELRPGEQAQTDEKDLMPYDVLDVIERAVVRDRRGPEDIVVVLGERFPTLPRADAIAHVRRFFGLFCRNQWKRERYAPSFHLDDESLDPKGFCRFPILSGGFRRELSRLG